MRYKRHETLRYKFKDPLPASFKIIKIDDHAVDTTQGHGHIINMSPGGLRLAINLKLPAKQKVQLFVETTILNHSLHFISDVVWTKPVGSTQHYGLIFIDDHHEEIMKILKEYHKKQQSNFLLG
ncbi:PilZ domain-containing protein [Halobacillus shinanisalinarum]|uniref:PilZ domain-containing protein n=1 Tax=Halobacillus shinanisalinarum TaxID=2932258 RepID=A0ABY4GX97_9BACI|nr:PilZ domain-containing protein [Halobacillus shinanisalinarum]UOQ92549.1 PilZ domain-containing protein [Halobacillus shinanisalinarum]